MSAPKNSTKATPKAKPQPKKSPKAKPQPKVPKLTESIMASASVKDYLPEQLERVPTLKPRDPKPSRGNFIVGQKLMRVCLYADHEGPRALPADRWCRSTKPDIRRNLPCDICANCIKLRARDYAQTVKDATAAAAGVKLTSPAQVAMLRDLPAVTGQNRRQYKALADRGLVTLADDTARRTLTGNIVLKGVKS